MHNRGGINARRGKSRNNVFQSDPLRVRFAVEEQAMTRSNCSTGRRFDGFLIRRSYIKRRKGKVPPKNKVRKYRFRPLDGPPKTDQGNEAMTRKGTTHVFPIEV